MVISQMSFSQAADLPHLKNESYASALAKMIKSGQTPFHSEEADICSDDEDAVFDEICE